MCRYVHKMTKLKSKITLKSQISKTLLLYELDYLAKKIFFKNFFLNIPNVWFKFSVVHPPSGIYGNSPASFYIRGIFTRQIERWNPPYGFSPAKSKGETPPYGISPEKSKKSEIPRGGGCTTLNLNHTLRRPYAASFQKLILKSQKPKDIKPFSSFYGGRDVPSEKTVEYKKKLSKKIIKKNYKKKKNKKKNKKK